MFDPPPAEPARVPPLSLALALTLAVFSGYLALGSTAQLLHLAFGLWFTEVVLFFGLAFVALRAVGRDPVRESGLDSSTLTAVVLGALVGLTNYLAWAVPLMALGQRALPRRVVELFDGSGIFLHQSGLELVALVGALGLAAPLCEEFFFRGVLQRGLMKRLEPPTAIVLTALVFSAFHLDPVGFLARFELGVVFGLLAWRAGSIWPAVAAHAANNLVATLLFFLAGDEPEGELPREVVFGLLLGGNAALAVVVALARGRLEAPRPAADAPVPPVPLVRSAWPFALASVLGLAAVLLLDARGIELRQYEQAHPLKPALAGDPHLEALRTRARRGEVPLEDYYQARELLAGPQTNE